MLPASASTAQRTAATAAQTPTGLISHLPQVTDPASLGNPAALLPRSSDPHELSNTAAAGHNVQVKATVPSSIQVAAGTSPDLPARERHPGKASCSDAAVSAVTPVLQATTQPAVKATQAVPISTAEAGSCVTHDTPPQGELAVSMQGLQTGRPPGVHTVPSSSGGVPAADTPQPADQQDDLLSDSDTESSPGSPVSKQTPHHNTPLAEDRHSPAAAALQGHGMPVGPLQAVSNDKGSQGGAVMPSSSDIRLAAHSPVPEGCFPLPQGTDAQPSMPCQSGTATAETMASQLLSKETAAPACVIALESGSGATPVTSPGPELQQLQLQDHPEAGIALPVVGSSASLLQAEAEAARLAVLLAPPVFCPPALTHHLAETGAGLPAENASTGSMQAPPLHAQLGAPPKSSSPKMMAGGASTAYLQFTSCQAGTAEAEPSITEQRLHVVERLPSSIKLPELLQESGQDSMQQKPAKMVPSSGLQLRVQVNQERLKSDVAHEFGDETPVTQFAQERAVSPEEDGADVVIPDRYNKRHADITKCIWHVVNSMQAYLQYVAQKDK